MIPMAYSFNFEPIQVALQRLPVMILTWVRLQPAAIHLQTILPPSNHLSLLSSSRICVINKAQPTAGSTVKTQATAQRILDQKF